MASTQKFEWLDAREHVLRRPDTHAGAVVPCDLETHVLRLRDGKWERRMVKVMLSPALSKVADEVLTNASDNSRRSGDQKVIETKFSPDGVFEVYNDGQTIPIKHWPGTTRYFPEILFGEMMTGENFDDTSNAPVGRATASA